MPQMSPVYWLIMMMYFILMLIILIMSIFFFFNLPTMNFSFMKINDSMNWMW